MLKMKRSVLLVLCSLAFCFSSYATAPSDKTPPNVIYIMLDELGYYELSHMKHPLLKTPHIDKMAEEGMRFTQCLAGAPVCGPTRAVLLTGLHSGHTSMRDNKGSSPIRLEEKTIATMLKEQGYVCGGFGKWGIGGRGTSGVPEKHGFDTFFGYYDQVHAHTFYPKYLIRNSKEVALKGNSGDSFTEGKTHAQNVIFDESIKFIRKNKDTPFFCYLPWTPPHGKWGINKDDPSWQLFKDKPWKAGESSEDDAKIYAAFVHMVDRQIGEIFKLLKELKIDDRTMVVVCGDNGGKEYFKSKEKPAGFFGPNKNPLTGKRYRGGKGSLYEGGLRIPFIVRWPGKIKAGTVSDHLCYFPDMMPTLADVCSASSPKTDGLSIWPTLSGKGTQKNHVYLYWEYGGQTAVRFGNWKAYKIRKNAWELYDLNLDVEETMNVASKNALVLEKLKGFAKEAHEPVKGGEYYDRALVEKDRLQAPHARNHRK